MPELSLTYTQQQVNSSKHNKGFTLLELLVVVAIIGALAAIAIPAYHGYVDKAKRTMAISALNTIRKTLESFHIDYSEYPEEPIDFTTGLDNQGRTVFSPSLRESISNDLFSLDSYTLISENYTVKVKAKDSDQTVLTMTPNSIY